ncbi:glycosyltransferase family 4 protein [Blastococcus capsensis]|uniref:glycosyltransferase family 4 protein n=1 Tax=Blastococcus capsensis TaxID=1564163 RepID=UPI002541BF3B|nr:glycosyltransferase family 4 protein [Blastococcus capsensis]MDK3256139.1 glycosyltransferase family 4 protein [Blastococcus capsensis]
MNTVPGTAEPATGRPRLLVLASTLPARPGDGTPEFVASLARVEATAFDTLVVAPLVPGGRPRDRQDGYDVHRFRFFLRRWEDLADGAILENLRARPSRWLQVPFFFAAGALAVRRAVRTAAPDVIHVHWIIPQGLMALLAARRVPWLVTTLGGDLYALTSRPARALKRRVLRRASAVTVMNEEMRDLVVGLGVAPSRVSVLPMGVDFTRVAGRPAAAERAPGRLVFVGRLVEKKGADVLLAALRRLPASVPWSLDLVGDGPLRGELEETAGSFGDRVVFHGQQSAAELGRMLAHAQVAVFPSVRARSGDQDGLPVAMLEAMAAGTAVVASDLPGLSEAVAGREPAGILVEPGSVSALATALERVITEDGLSGRIGRAAAARAEAYSVDAIGRRYIELLRAAAAAPSSGARGSN